ncbi:MAG: hypothetical protein HOI59_08760 [Nitrospina sp.]|jgi:hypothetical protein|nr:hypothetical protein [Nitrospina sp.]MBT3857720.1 hypothetical protein [Nitrospina sp.]MBT4105006.1 hypothetical protein [Nitrospina sp.]MBT4388252.1 hypothetical protein [Nitrospina sp.]MBT4619819.1 hypothetical protein [Nitrospina sp.]
MKQKLGFMALMVLAFLLAAVPGYSASTGELERKIDLLADEVDDLKSRGIGAGTSDHNRVSVHGYGEMHFNRTTQERGSTQIDNHRFVIGVHALLTDWIHLNAEIDFEHAAQELEFEFGYLDFLLSPGLNARAGVMLAPVGLLNEFHEPNLFWTSERPLLQSRMIPTTWSAGGAGLFGTPMEGVNYRLYAMNSLQSITKDSTANGGGSGGNGGSGDSFGTNGIRGGRKQVNEAVADDWSVFARVEFTKLFPGLQVGFSLVNGDTTHNIISADGNMTLLEADIQYRWNWFDMNASIVNTDIDDAGAMNTFCAAGGAVDDCAGGIASNNFGYNVQAGVHLPQLMGWKTSHDIVPHFMFERVRTQDEMPAGTDPDKSKNRNAVYTFGVAYLPIPEVALKVDHTHTMLQDNTSTDQFNMAIAYMY